MTSLGQRSAFAALDSARPAIARLDTARHPEDTAADIIEAWDGAQRALRALSGVGGLSGHALIRDTRQRNMLTLDQAHALVEFSAAADRARDTSYIPTAADVTSARTGFQQLEVAINHPPPLTGPVDGTPRDTPTSTPIASHTSDDAEVIVQRRQPNWTRRAVMLAVLLAALGAVGYGWWYWQYRPNVLLERARQAYVSGNRSAAYEAFEDAARAAPRSAEPHIFLGRMYREDGRKELAAEELRRAIELEPENGLALREMAAHLLASGNLDLARRFYVRAVEKNPSDRNAVGFLGCTLLRLGRVQEGLRFIQRAGQGSWTTCAAAAAPPPPVP